MAAEARAGDAGFTLVEVLVSLALCGLVAVLTLQTFRATGLINRTARRLEAQGEVQLVREHLRRVLADRAGRRPNGRHPPFQGEPGRLVATVQANRDVARGAEVLLVLETRLAGDGLALVEASGTPEVPGAPEPLLDRVAGLRLRYFGSQGGDPTPRWTPVWSRRDRPPALVEVVVAFPPDDSRLWPPLVLALGSGS